MFVRSLITITAFAAIAGSAGAQSFQRRAVMSGGGNPNRGKCTVEVVVDGAVDVEIQGDSANLRNLNGRPPQWRRFECTGVMPVNPANFRFSGVDGRGSQELIRDPRGGGPAVIRIQDPESGAEGYTFDIEWEGGGGAPGRYPDRIGGADRDRAPDWNRSGGRRFTTDQAVQACQDAVSRQAADRFRARDVQFRRTTLDDNPGRNDWVIGTFSLRSGGDREEVYRFSCSVNFDTGQIRSAQIDPSQGGQYGPGDRDNATSNSRALQSCQAAVEQRLRRDGYRRIDFGSLNADDGYGRNGAIVGTARADRDSFDFSCNVDRNDGDVRNVDVRRR